MWNGLPAPVPVEGVEGGNLCQTRRRQRSAFLDQIERDAERTFAATGESVAQRFEGDDPRHRPHEDRCQMLCANTILFSAAIEAECALVFSKACEMGLQGIVSKRAGIRLLERI